MSRKITLIIIIALLTTIITIGILLIVPKSNSEIVVVEEEKEEEEEIIYYAYDIGDAFITNMCSSNRYVKVSVILQLKSEEEKELLEEENYIIRHTIIEILRNKTEEEYKDNEILNELRINIKEELEEILNVESIEDVYFTELVIQ